MSASGRTINSSETAGAARGAGRAGDDYTHLWPVRVASVLMGILWITQALWKLPWNSFGSPGLQPNPNPTAQQPGPYIDNGEGLYHWMTQEALHGNWLLPFYGDLIKNLVLPNWQIVGWMTFIMEVFIGISLLLGLLSRLGGFLSLLQSFNLFLGLSTAPGEWAWTYIMLMLFGFVFMLTGPGRLWGIDRKLRSGLRDNSEGDGGLAKWLYRLT